MYEGPAGTLYGFDMVKRTLMGVDEARTQFSRRLDAAIETGEQTVVTRHGKPVAAIVSMEWLRRAAEALGEPTEL